jgi:hypothetical protein
MVSLDSPIAGKRQHRVETPPKSRNARLLQEGNNIMKKKAKNIFFAGERPKGAFFAVLIALALSAMLIVNLHPALAAAVEAGYRDFSYGTESAPTGQKPQSKLWHNDGNWWGSLYNRGSGKYEIYRFNWSDHAWTSTGTVLDARRRSSADVLWDGNYLYVVSAIPPGISGDNSIYLFRYSYNSGSKNYSISSGFPISLGSRAVEAVVMDKDTTGMLWVTFTDSNTSGGRNVYVMHSTNSDLTWTEPYVIPTTGASNLKNDDISAVVSFNNNIGVMWSNQNNDTMYFAIHQDGAPDTQWSLNPALQGPKYADDHLNLKSLIADDSGQVFAAVKTSLNDLSTAKPEDPLVLLLILDRQGSWSRRTFGRVVDDHTRPIVLIDNQNRQVYVFATVPVGSATSGAIYYKSISLDNKSMQFATGLGTPFMLSNADTRINNATSTKQALNSSTGLLVIAGDDTAKYYFHNTINLGAAPPDPATVTPDATATEVEIPPTPTATHTSTSPPVETSPTPTLEPTATDQPVPTKTPRKPPKDTPTETLEPSSTETLEPEATPTEVPVENSSTPTLEPSPTQTPEPEATPTKVPVVNTPTPTPEPLPTETPEPEATPTEVPVVNTPTPTHEPLSTQTPEPEATPTLIPVENSPTPEPSPTETPPAPTDTPVPEPSPTEDPTPTQTPEPTPTQGLTLKFQDGFESGNFSAWTQVITGADGAAVVQSEIVKSGGFAARLSATDNAGSLAYARKLLQDSPREIVVSGDFMITEEGIRGNNVPLIRLYNTEGNRIVNVFRLNLNGNKIGLQHSGKYHDTSGTMPLNSWANVEVRVNVNPSGPGSILVYLDGNQIYQSNAASLGSSGIQNVQIGNETAKQTFTIYVDNILINH